MKKGFTLVELLAVLVVIGLVAGITIPVVDKIMVSGRKKAHDEQVKMVEKRAEDYVNTHISILGDEDLYVSVTTLIDNGYFDQDELIDPITSEPMSGCVKVSYSETYGKYIYTYGNACE